MCELREWMNAALLGGVFVAMLAGEWHLCGGRRARALAWAVLCAVLLAAVVGWNEVLR